MRARILLAASAAALGALAAGFASPAAGDTKIGDGGFFVDAFDDFVVWSALDDGRARLFAKEADGEPLRVPGAGSSDGPMDVDVGPGPDGGRDRLVYQRCTGLAKCDIYRLDPATQTRDRKMGFSSKELLDVAPSQWRGTYVFGRTRDAQAGRSDSKRGGLFVKRRGKPVSRWTSRIPADTDIRGERIAYQYIPAGGSSSTYIYLTTTTSRKTCTVDRGTDHVFLDSPTLDGGYIYWLEIPDDASGERTSILRAPLDEKGCGTGEIERSERTLPGFGKGQPGPNGLAAANGILYWSDGDEVRRIDAPAAFPASG